MAQGKVKKLIGNRGFGFINAEDEKEEFFHRSGVQGMNFDSLKEGDSVEFDVEKGDKGPRAINVRLLEE